MIESTSCLSCFRAMPPPKINQMEVWRLSEGKTVFVSLLDTKDLPTHLLPKPPQDMELLSQEWRRIEGQSYQVSQALVFQDQGKIYRIVRYKEKILPLTQIFQEKIHFLAVLSSSKTWEGRCMFRKDGSPEEQAECIHASGEFMKVIETHMEKPVVQIYYEQYKPACQEEKVSSAFGFSAETKVEKHGVHITSVVQNDKECRPSYIKKSRRIADRVWEPLPSTGNQPKAKNIWEKSLDRIGEFLFRGWEKITTVAV